MITLSRPKEVEIARSNPRSRPRHRTPSPDLETIPRSSTPPYGSEGKTVKKQRHTILIQVSYRRSLAVLRQDSKYYRIQTYSIHYSSIGRTLAV